MTEQTRSLSKKAAEFLRTQLDRKLPTQGPKEGKIDPENKPHIGGSTWQGGTGGRDTAGLGGKGGPFRVDSGHEVHQISDEEKSAVNEDIKKVVNGPLRGVRSHFGSKLARWLTRL